MDTLQRVMETMAKSSFEELLANAGRSIANHQALGERPDDRSDEEVRNKSAMAMSLDLLMLMNCIALLANAKGIDMEAEHNAILDEREKAAAKDTDELISNIPETES